MEKASQPTDHPALGASQSDETWALSAPVEKQRRHVLDLPFEVRNKILRYLLSTDKDESYKIGFHESPHPSHKQCAGFYQEGREVLFNQNQYLAIQGSKGDLDRVVEDWRQGGIPWRPSVVSTSSTPGIIILPGGPLHPFLTITINGSNSETILLVSLGELNRACMRLRQFANSMHHERDDEVRFKVNFKPELTALRVINGLEDLKSFVDCGLFGWIGSNIEAIAFDRGTNNVAPANAWERWLLCTFQRCNWGSSETTKISNVMLYLLQRFKILNSSFVASQTFCSLSLDLEGLKSLTASPVLARLELRNEAYCQLLVDIEQWLYWMISMADQVFSIFASDQTDVDLKRRSIFFERFWLRRCEELVSPPQMIQHKAYYHLRRAENQLVMHTVDHPRKIVDHINHVLWILTPENLIDTNNPSTDPANDTEIDQDTVSDEWREWARPQVAEIQALLDARFPGETGVPRYWFIHYKDLVDTCKARLSVVRTMLIAKFGEPNIFECPLDLWGRLDEIMATV